MSSKYTESEKKRIQQETKPNQNGMSLWWKFYIQEKIKINML